MSLINEILERLDDNETVHSIEFTVKSDTLIGYVLGVIQLDTIMPSEIKKHTLMNIHYILEEKWTEIKHLNRVHTINVDCLGNTKVKNIDDYYFDDKKTSYAIYPFGVVQNPKALEDAYHADAFRIVKETLFEHTEVTSEEWIDNYEVTEEAVFFYDIKNLQLEGITYPAVSLAYSKIENKFYIIEADGGEIVNVTSNIKLALQL